VLVTTYRTVTLENAQRAIKVYNEGLYGCLKNPEVDQQARDMFADGLGSTSAEILRQVEFIGRNYGGAAGFKAAYSLAPDITRDIFANRQQYNQTAVSALPLLSQIPSRNTIEILYRPFIKPLHGKSHWQVWATKFWHFLNPDAFPIEDRYVNQFFVISDANSVDTYLKFLNRFREFALSHQKWISNLREIDGDADGEIACRENKLWDKMCYGFGDLARAAKKRK
jgi:hypothetical protein